MLISIIISVVLTAISAALSIALQPHVKTQDASAAKLSDFDMPTTDEGTAQTVLFGDRWTANWFVLWFGNFRTSAITTTQKGKK